MYSKSEVFNFNLLTPTILNLTERLGVLSHNNILYFKALECILLSQKRLNKISHCQSQVHSACFPFEELFVFQMATIELLNNYFNIFYHC